jgi:hypothetical protein
MEKKLACHCFRSVEVSSYDPLVRVYSIEIHLMALVSQRISMMVKETREQMKELGRETSPVRWGKDWMLLILGKGLEVQICMWEAGFDVRLVLAG